jgi:uncharacterized membrane protein YccC
MKDWILHWVNPTTVVQAKMAFKMSVAATVSCLIAQGLNWQYPFYAVIAAILVMGTTSGNTWNQGVQRILGTAIGVVAGIAFSVLLGNTPWAIAMTSFVAIFLAYVLSLPEAAKLSGFLSVTIILNQQGTPWDYAWGRFLESGLGILVAVFVSNLIFPAHAGSELRRCYFQLLENLEEFYQLIMQGALQNTYDRNAANEIKLQIFPLLQESRNLRQEIHQGQAGEPNATLIDESWDFLVYRIWEHIATMEHIVITRQDTHHWQTFTHELTQLAYTSSQAMLTLAGAVRSRQIRPSLPDLEAALDRATSQFTAIESSASTYPYPVDPLLKFITFFYTMEEVGRKLLRLADTLSR